MENEDFWREQINSIRGDGLPENGLNAPDLESIPPETVPDRGRVTRIQLDLYMFEGEGGGKSYMIYSTQKLHDYGHMLLHDAIQKAKRNRNSK